MDGHELALKAFRSKWKPKTRLKVSEWADGNRVLSSIGSSSPGKWKTSRTPYLREIMDMLSEDSTAGRVVFMKPSQIGGTEVASNWLGYIISHAQCPVAVVMPTERSLNDWMSQKFEPMAQDTKSVRESLYKRNNSSSDNNSQRKKFSGGILYAKTAGSTSELKSTSLKYAIADEVDEYVWSSVQGEPIGLLEVRLTTFTDSKIYIVSSPTIKGSSRIEELFLAGDRRRYHVPCPLCGFMQVLAWENLKWTKHERNEFMVTHAEYLCRQCGGGIDERHKHSMLCRGEWIAESPDAPYPSYAINALYAPMGVGLTWSELAEEWLVAQDDLSKVVVFVNTRLGEPWADRSKDINAGILQDRAENYGLRTAPDGCSVITCGVDVQDDRLELQVLGHGRHGVAWTLDYCIIHGNPTDDEPWETLTKYVNGIAFANSNGISLMSEACAIDSGGHNTHAVYAYVRSMKVRRVMACKGSSQRGKAILNRPTMQDVNWKGLTAKRGVRLYAIGTDTAKHLLYNRIDGDADKPPGERKVRFSSHLAPEFFEQLIAETFNPRKNVWEIKRGKRNEALDTWILAVAASHHHELTVHKWTPNDWDRREALLGTVKPYEGAVVPPRREVMKHQGIPRRPPPSRHTMLLERLRNR